MDKTESDKFFAVKVLRQTPNPQQLIYADMHQCYAEELVFDDLGWENLPERDGVIQDPCNTDQTLTEEQCGDRIVKNLLSGNRGHYGPLENPQITFNVGYFPHSTIQQIRTHRVGVHFSVQSFRYTGKRIIDVAKDERDVEEVFYLRPVGTYSDRQGKRYEYTKEMREYDMSYVRSACDLYADRIRRGYSEEHARDLMPFAIRQHWVMSANVRSLMHILDLRWKADAQLECQQLCDLIWPHFQAWVPAIAEWYEKNRAKKARLAP